MTDVIVVGSGPGGVNAAAPLVGAGRRVLMLDYGNQDRRYASLIPNQPFSEIRRTDREQHRYFLGDDFEGIPFGPVRVGAQLTPPRMHILADAAERIPVETDGFSLSMSLARGGLGAGWSAGVFPFSDDELRAMGPGLADMQPHYDAVAERIGVAGDRDDLEAFLPSSPSMMPALELDTNAETVFTRYAGARAALNARGFFLGKTRLAACTLRHRERGPEQYRDMSYWADLDRSVYRPQWTLDELCRSSSFEYLDRRFVRGFAETGEGVRVTTVHADTGAEEVHESRAVVLAAGTVGTASIVLRSLACYDTPVPLLCNAYAYVPTINLGMFGRTPRDRRSSLAQLTALLRIAGAAERPERLVQAQLFSYRSLLTFKLMKEFPLAFRESLRVLRLLVPYFAVLGIHHTDRPGPGKRCVLRRGTDGASDRLEITYRASAEEDRMQIEDERAVVRCFRRLGCLPLKTIRPGHGASLHYAGTFPMLPGSTDRLTCDTDGRLRATRAVYLADGSIFPWIPPKGLTFNLMAHADRVGALLAKRLA
jgi:choline dehydrogenase-like flavoprotein